MGAAHPLYAPRDSAVHRLPGEAKIAASVLFTVVVVLTPREELWAFGVYAGLIAAAAALARIGPLWLLSRTVIEAPFVGFAVLLPFMVGGPQTEWLGLSLSVEGLYGAWNIAAKATLGVWSSLLLAGTTTPTALLAGLERLRVPSLLVQIAVFMVRYLHLLLDQARRMRLARLARGDDPRFLWQARALAASIGVLFLRCFERGERVHLAMLSRGYAGAMPLAVEIAPAGAAQWAAAALLPAAAAGVAASAILV